ncbi:MAG: hypothetical protein HQ507_13115 [Candidatus Marinimicrobia bacterium]|nr:hypothetical protein [Candidatus Neomarinimicrobiota bacterium]
MKRLIGVLIISMFVFVGCNSKHACKMDQKEHAGKAHVHSEACGDSCTMGKGDEHAGKEHGGAAVGQEHGGNAVAKKSAGQEHGGQEHGGQEHAGQEHGGQAAQSYSAAEIKGAMNAHISMREADGVFKIMDEKTGKELSLKFVKIHDPVRKIEGKGFFACTDFEVVGETGKLYDLDFWLNPEGGKLVVTEGKIHKHPIASGSGWEKKARYTFINDNPVEIE